VFLHKGKPLIVDHSVRIDMRDEVSSIGTDIEEIESNAFAAAFLMPQDMVIEHIKSYVTKVTSLGNGLTREDLVAELAREGGSAGHELPDWDGATSSTGVGACGRAS
jgi:Zn-dependent peptidase ImmA (M78 family)